MRAARSTIVVVVAAVVALAACGLPPGDYAASIDAIDGDDGALAIVVDDFPAQVDELGSGTFTVKLNRAPGRPVSIALTTTGPCTVSPDRFELSDATFATGQPVVVNGLDDPDAHDDDGTVDAAADGLETRHLVTTIHDTDRLTFVTNVAGVQSVDELGPPVPFTVELSARPPGAVSVAVTTTSGAVVAMPNVLSFDEDDWSDAKTVTLTAPDDANTVNEDVNVELRDTGTTGVPTAVVQARTIDNDVLQILAAISPNPLTLVEQGASGTIDVTLNGQPPVPVQVTVTVTAGIQANTSAVDFTTTDWNQAHPVRITVPGDDDTAGGAATVTLSATVLGMPLQRTVNVAITDDDQPEILTTAAPPLAVVEGQFVELDVWLRFRPAGAVQLNLSSVPAGLVTVTPPILMFDELGNNYATPQTVRVTGTSDLNLQGGTTSVRIAGAGAPTLDLTTTVTDDDVQQIVATPSPLTVLEGMSAPLNVHLMFQPSATVTVTAMSGSGELVLSGPPLSFDSGNYTMDKPVTATATADSDVLDDATTITLAGAGAPTPTTVNVTTTDRTIVERFGYPTQFPGSQNVNNGSVLAYRFTTTTTTTLDRFGLIATLLGGDFKMAIYRDAGNVPGDLAFSIDTRQTVAAAGVREVDVLDQQLTTGSYWLAVRAAPQVSLGYSGASPTATICSRNLAITNLDVAWPSPFGAATCSTAGILNLYLVTYRQPP